MQLAPSALFKQPVRFRQEKDRAYAEVAHTDSFEMVDLGIAMLHFEIGAQKVPGHGEILLSMRK